MADHAPTGWELALTAGMVALAITLGEERKEELLARAVVPQEGWEREVRRSCNRDHQECSGLGMRYEMHHRPKLWLEVYECDCVKYELVYRPILIPSANQLEAESAGAAP